MCLQIINRCSALAPHPPTAFYVHPYTEVVLIGTTHLGALEPLVDDDQFAGDRVVSHDRPLCAALYNHNFNQVNNTLVVLSQGWPPCTHRPLYLYRAGHLCITANWLCLKGDHSIQVPLYKQTTSV